MDCFHVYDYALMAQTFPLCIGLTTAGTGVSYAGHFGGFIMGMTLGTYMLRNLKQRWYEIYVKWFGVSVALTGIVFAILFNSFNDPDENNLCPSFSRC